jgi:hypothetical protein
MTQPGHGDQAVSMMQHGDQDASATRHHDMAMTMTHTTMTHNQTTPNPTPPSFSNTRTRCHVTHDNVVQRQTATRPNDNEGHPQ